MIATPDFDFAALGAPAPLDAALRARNYLTPTPVQARVLEAADKDLLVSSQTVWGRFVHPSQVFSDSGHFSGDRRTLSQSR